MARSKASPVQGEVGKIFDFARRGCQSLSQPARLTAPFTQGSLGRFRASTITWIVGEEN